MPSPSLLPTLHFSAMTSTVSAATATTTLYKRHKNTNSSSLDMAKKLTNGSGGDRTVYGFDASFLKWGVNDVVNVVKIHWLPCFFALGLLFFMGVEYTLFMVPASAPPFDLGFIVTRRLHLLLSSWPELNTLLAFLNTVFVLMQTTYILWTWLVEGRPRATISALFMFTCRGILGYSTQLPLPQEFLGSGADFPVGNVSFFLFFSGHVAGSVIASLDMRRMQRWGMAWAFDALNILQTVRLLGSRGHYTIDLATGIGAGILFDSLAGKYEESKRKQALLAKEASLFS
ncbi:phosphatidylcholine:diacylglycerol cholinephosphotransferase 1-like [Mercurialis annua]|uniref:phosphatidylcholine:diacylglycerol cholinephosphotransferase 1-like n=1 Tax=Mercurialis annua TaxID=3986 RepID=UPI00215F5FE6|nr:phosphatidylcholine:diacylglycerol cholinephosphotransferase 1-like [Mercurialis annua]